MESGSPRDGVDRSLYTRLAPWRNRSSPRGESSRSRTPSPATEPEVARPPSPGFFQPSSREQSREDGHADEIEEMMSQTAISSTALPAMRSMPSDAGARSSALRPARRPHQSKNMFDVAVAATGMKTGLRGSYVTIEEEQRVHALQDRVAKVLQGHTPESSALDIAHREDQVRFSEMVQDTGIPPRSSLGIPPRNSLLVWSAEDIPFAPPPKASIWQRAYIYWRHGNFVIVPDIGDNRLANRLLDCWDIMVVICILGTAIVLPFEVSVVHFAEFRFLRVLDFLFDVSFASDILLQFFIAVPNHHAVQSTDLWERDPLKIAQRYCSLPLCIPKCRRLGWFWIDISSVFPFAHFLGKSNPQAIRVCRMLRLVRMVSLVRLMRLFDRWQAVFGFSYHLVSLVEFLGLTFFSCHWMACIWVMAEGSLYRDRNELTGPHGGPGRTWLTALIESKGDPCRPSAKEDPLCVYSLALYFATMTLTTVGFGDIVPQNLVEYRMVIVMVMISGIIWAYVVGSIVNIISTWDPSQVLFRQNLDDLNEMCSNRNLPHGLRCRLRSYMHEAKFIQRIRSQRGLVVNHLSPGLQGEVALQSVGSVIYDNVYWARDLEEAAIIDLATRLQAALFAPREHIVMPMSLVILMRGVAASFGRILSRGHVWGHDRVLLESFFLIESFVPRTLSYVEVLSLSKDDVRAVCANFPAADKKVRRAQIRLATMRAIVALADVVRRWRTEADYGFYEAAMGNDGFASASSMISAIGSESPESAKANEDRKPIDDADTSQSPKALNGNNGQERRHLELMEQAIRELKQWNVYGSFCGLNGPTEGHEVSIRQELNAMEERMARMITTAMVEISEPHRTKRDHHSTSLRNHLSVNRVSTIGEYADPRHSVNANFLYRGATRRMTQVGDVPTSKK